MIKGVGTDILKISRVCFLEEEKKDSNIIRSIYSEKELDLIQKKVQDRHRYATHFAGKEAVFKALNLGSAALSRWNDIEILYQESGQPYVILHGLVKKICMEKEIAQISLSLSWDTEYAVAFAVAEA